MRLLMMGIGYDSSIQDGEGPAMREMQPDARRWYDQADRSKEPASRWGQ